MRPPKNRTFQARLSDETREIMGRQAKAKSEELGIRISESEIVAIALRDYDRANPTSPKSNETAAPR